MNRACYLVVVLLLLCAGIVSAQNKPDDKKPAPLAPPFKWARPENVSDEMIVASMQKGVDYLLSKQKNGSWEDIKPDDKHTRYAGGISAFVTYALLHAGKSLPNERRLALSSDEMKAAVEYVKTIRNNTTYVRAYQLATLAQLPKTQQNQAMLRALANPLPTGFGPRGHGYFIPWGGGGPNPTPDASNTQIALLAAMEIDAVGVELPNAYWQGQNNYWRRAQRPDGSWNYRLPEDHKDDKPSEHAMTVAGLASLYILQEQLDTNVGLVAKPDRHIENALAWLDKNFKKDTPFSSRETLHYYVYTLERAGLAAGRKYIGGVDWYRAAAARVLQEQAADGRWAPDNVWFDLDNPYVTTSMALIFLARGRNPVAFNKLEYEGNTWNARARDVANVTSWMSRNLERPANWQVVDLKSNPEDWLDAPVLLITGSADPKFTDEDLKKLRAFVDAGGVIFSTADGNTAAFTTVMQNYIMKMTNNQFEPRQLPNDHPVFGAWLKVKQPPRMLGLSNGVRELWIHSTVDLGAAWQRKAIATPDSFHVAANVFFYAAGGADAMRPRLKSTHIAMPKGEVKVNITIGRLEYAGNFDPEPGAWPRFSRVLRSEGIGLTVENVKLEALDVKKTPIVHMTGTTAFTLSDEAQAALKKFIADGGTLVADNAGGNNAFDEAFKKMLGTLLPDTPLMPLAAEHPLFGDGFAGGQKMGPPQYRREFILRNGRQNMPVILAATVNGRAAVLYSPADIASGLLGTQTLGVLGFTPAGSHEMARQLLTYAASTSKPAPAGKK